MSSAALLDESQEPEIHKSTTERLIYMANQIAQFFESQGAEAQGVLGVADHIKSFWSRTMLRDIYAHLDATGGEGLRPYALKAIQQVRQARPHQLREKLESLGQHSGEEPGDDAG